MLVRVDVINLPKTQGNNRLPRAFFGRYETPRLSMRPRCYVERRRVRVLVDVDIDIGDVAKTS